MAFKRFGRDILVYGVTDLLFRGAQFLILPVYVRVLTVADFGLLALIQGSAMLLGMLFNLGANNAVQRYYFDSDLGPGRRPAVVSAGLVQVFCSVGIGVALALLAGWAFRAQLHDSYGMTWLLIALALASILPDQIAQYSLDAVRLQFEPRRFVLVALVKNLLGLALGLFFLLAMGMGVAGILLGTLVGSTLAVPIGLVMIRANLTRAIDLRLMRTLLHFGLPFVLAGAAYWVFGSIDRWMLAEMSNIEEVGLFSIAFKFAAVVSIAIAAFGQAWSPFAYSLAAEDDGYRRVFSHVLSLWFFVLALLAFTVSIFAGDIVRIVTPPAYWPSASMLAIGVCGIALFGTTLVSSIGLAIHKMPMRLTAAAWIAAASNVAANLVLIPLFGGVGAAFSTLISYSILATLLLHWSQKVHPLPLDWPKLGFSAALLALAVGFAVSGTLGTGGGWTWFKVALVFGALAGGAVVGLLSSGMLVDLRRVSAKTSDLAWSRDPRGVPGGSE